MKYAIALLALCALSVHGLPSHKTLPDGLTSFQPKQVLAYVQKMAARQLMQPRMISQDNDQHKLNSMQCFQKSSASLSECAEKAEQGSARCERILSVATVDAEANRDSERKEIDARSTNIQSDLGSCQGDSHSAEDALTCYEKKGQLNVNPVSSLSSSARTAQRNYSNTISAARTKSQGCSYDVSAESEAASAQIFNNLNVCMDTGVWNEYVIPDFGPVEPATTLRPTTSRPTTHIVVTPEPEPDTEN